MIKVILDKGVAIECKGVNYAQLDSLGVLTIRKEEPTDKVEGIFILGHGMGYTVEDEPKEESDA